MEYSIKQIIIIPTNEAPPQITISLQNFSLFLGIILTSSVLLSLAIKAVISVNQISLSITQINEKLKDYSLRNDKHLEQSNINAEKIRALDKELDLQKQEYINRKDVVQMMLGQLDQKINHKFTRLLFYTRDMQHFLQKDTQFQIREYEESQKEEE